MVLDAATPDFVGGLIGVGGKIFERGVAEARGVERGHFAKDAGRDIGVAG